MDFLEQAFEEEQGRLDNTVRRVGSQTDHLEPTGYCLNCYEDVADNQLFCNGACATDYTEKKKRQKGR